MAEWLKDLLVAIGGVSVALIGIFTILQKFFINFLESGIESSFEKKMERYKNHLLRSTKAYEFLLEREMRFYEHIEPIFAELIPLVHDLFWCLENDEDREYRYEESRKNIGRYVELTKNLKYETLIHQSYIPSMVFSKSSNVVVQMQDDLNYWYEMIKYLNKGEYDKIDYDSGKIAVRKVLENIAIVEAEIKKRLDELCGI